MPALGPFTPAGTVNVAATTATGSVALPLVARDQIMVTNDAGGSLAFIAFGDSTVEADDATSTPVLPGAAYVFTINPNTTHMAAITGTGTATVYATAGQGA
jgi:hypothetical protein